MTNGKRIFTLAFRRWLVEQTRQPGASVAGLALRHGINANQLRRWMSVDHKLAHGNNEVALLAVNIEGSTATSMVAVPASPPPPGHIELEVFGARLKLHGEVDGLRLRVVLDALARRS
ncbi:transposase [Variovorax sp. ZS18.2.2]|uniref:transposase n=1 Tax=Variovorax sp. ZS18.2.2 TaxID=2971255 RepID=UPI0021512050|nr:transposase [Variovorax sp. ZS18.2.2]MCR6480856.1 transposase [Variovorax sp. ZS18.2.2]